MYIQWQKSKCLPKCWSHIHFGRHVDFCQLYWYFYVLFKITLLHHWFIDFKCKWYQNTEFLYHLLFYLKTLIWFGFLPKFFTMSEYLGALNKRFGHVLSHPVIINDWKILWNFFCADHLTTILGDTWPTFCQLFLYLLTKIQKSQKYINYRCFN